VQPLSSGHVRSLLHRSLPNSVATC
jgi:hypothetical protein